MSRPKNVVRSISSEGNLSTYDICLVGFPRKESRGEVHVSSLDVDLADWVHLVPHLAPEARVFDFVLLADNVAEVDGQPPSPDQTLVVDGESSFSAEDGGLKSSSQDASETHKESCNGERSCSAKSLEQEAYFLLDVTKEQDLVNKKFKWRPIIFVAYGLGGLVVKQAMVIANTDPRYCDVFVATPHNEADLATWENILDEMIMAAGVKFKGRKSRVLAELAVSVNKVASYFHCALKYRIMNLSGHAKSSSRTSSILDDMPLLQSSTDDDFRLEPGRLPPSQLFTTKKGQITELDLRGFLFPETLLTDYIWDPEKLEASLFYSDLLDFLQVLSPSNRPIHQSTAMQVLDEDLPLEMYTRRVSIPKPLKQHSIQVIGFPGHGKATLVKLIVQKVMRYMPDALLLDILLEPSEMTNLDLRTLLQSFVHQIVSQRPALFSHIRPLYLKHRKSHGTATQGALWTFLHILLRVSQDWKIVIAANNVHLWPETVQSSLKTLEKFLQSLNSNYLFISSSTREIFDLCLTSRQVLDLGLDSYRNSSIQAKVKAVLFAHPALQTEAPPEHLRDIALPEVLSVANADCYAKVLSRGFLLSTLEVVDAALVDCPRTEDAIFHHSVKTLNRAVLGWSSSAISWVQKAARPLRTRELAVAVALGEGPLELSKLIPRIPASIQTDIVRHLDVMLRVDGDLVHFYNGNTRRLLAEKRPDVQGVQSLQLLTDAQLAGLCLEYISAVVSKVSQDVCLAQVTWRQQVQNHDQGQAELEFLDYAVRYWPTHYRAHIQLSAERRALDRQQEDPSKLPQEPREEPDTLEAKVLAFLADDSVRRGWYRLLHVKSVPEENMANDVEALEVTAELGLFSIVESLLLAAGEPAETTPVDLRKLLRTAVRHGHSDLVDLFLRKGAKRDGAVLEAASLGRVDYLEKLLPDGALQDDHEHLLESALHKAAQSGSLPAVKFFDRSNLDWTWTDSEGRTVLHAAATGGKVGILNHIMEGRALDLNARDKDGKSPLMIATQLNQALFAKALCERRADATLADNDGKTALHHAIIKDPNTVTLLLQHNASPVEPDKQKQTPLHFACRLGDLGIVTHLIRVQTDGKSINIRNEDNETPLHIAAACGNSIIVNFLLEQGADTSTEDSEGRKPIDLAAAGGHLDAFQELYPRSEDSSSTREALVMQSASMGQLLIVRFLLSLIPMPNPNFLVKGQSPLAVAALKGYTGVVRLLLQKEADPNFADEDGRYPLNGAVSGEHADVVTILLRAGADPDVLDRDRWRPLHHAASGGMTKVVEALLSHGANVDGRTIVKDTALHLSVAHPNIVEKLLECKPELAPPNYSGLTPLHLAVTGHHVETVKLLAKKEGKLAHIPDEDGYTPLHRSIEADHYDTGVFKILWPGGGLDLHRHSYRNEPLILYALKQANLDAVRFVLAQDPAMAASSYPGGVSALHVAAENGYKEILDELLKASDDLDVNSPSADGRSPLHLAAAEAGKDTVQKLLDLGANVDAVDGEGKTALFRAAWNSRTESVICLLDADADPNIRDGSTWGPLHAAADNAQILDALLKHGAELDYAEEIYGWTALMCAAFWGSEAGMETLLNYKASISISNKQGQTALHLAEQEGNPRLSGILLEASADVAATDDSGKTPLHYAASHSGTQEEGAFKVQELLEKRAVVNCKDNQGDTPLHWCAAVADWGGGPPLLLQTLVKAYREKALSIEEKNNEGQTPLHRALYSGTLKASEILLDKGASLNERDGDGRSYLASAAAGTESKRKVELLLKVGREQETLPWTLDDKVAAFMAALTTDLDLAMVLAEDDKRIFQGQNDTFTVLGLCLDFGQHEEAAEFLRLGANPFRHKDGQLSAFQRASLDKEPDSPFVEACLEMLDKGLSGLDDQFQALRLRIEQRGTGVYSKIRQWLKMPGTRQITDQDGWTMDHFLFQSKNTDSSDHMGVTLSSITTLRTPTRFIIPGFWRANEDSEVVILSSDGKEVQYLGPPDQTEYLSVRADHPFPPRGVSGALYYFEVEILRGEDTPEAPTVVGIGLCGEFVDMRDEFPGWDTCVPSAGYHGDNGRMYDSRVDEKESKGTSRTFAEGDTVGCGIDWNNGSVYYTLNGEWVGKSQTSIIYQKLYPMISMGDMACTVRVNFGEKTNREGQAFKFQVPI